MADLTAQRTLVKSPPELWSELSEVESLAKHLGELGEIRITKVEPETTVAWEGEQISGTVELEQAGWGTRVTFRATVPEPVTSQPPPPEPPTAELPPEPPAAELSPEPVAPEPAAVEPDRPSELYAEPRRGSFLARWLFRQRRPIGPETATAVPAPAPPAAEPVPASATVVPERVATPEPEPVVHEPGPVDGEAERVQAVLDGTLEALGQAHHRPFSRG